MNIKDEIKLWKEKKDAVILAHYYVEPEVQEIADHVGDSFALSKIAAGLPNPVIVYCGVSFMGESGVLLSPNKKVLMPDALADYMNQKKAGKNPTFRASDIGVTGTDYWNE